MPRVATLLGSRLRHWCGSLKVLVKILFRYCPLLKRMQLAFRARVESLNNHVVGRAKRKQVNSVKDTSLSMHGLLSTGRRLLVVSLMTSPQLNLHTALTAPNATEHNFVTSHAQNTTALQSSIFLTGIHRLLVTNKERSAFPNANNCQGQLQSPRSVSVLYLRTRLPVNGVLKGSVQKGDRNCHTVFCVTANKCTINIATVFTGVLINP